MICQWPVLSGEYSLSQAQVDVWCLELSAAQFATDLLKELLAESELARAKRFHFTTDRRNFVIRRAVLRLLLGRYLNIPPSRITYVTDKFGKPALDQSHKSDVKFNLSASGEIALLAFARTRSIGVDIERVRMELDIEPIARRFFSPNEQAVLSSLVPEARRLGFYNCWTRKEAVLKALGQGLSLALDSFDVNLAMGEPARILAARGEAQPALHLQLKELDLIAGYCAALAYEGVGCQVNCWRFDPAHIAAG